MKTTQIMLVCAALGLSSCTSHGIVPWKRSYLSVVGAVGDSASKQTIGSIFVWSNDVNAAVIYRTGTICAQRAMAVLTADARLTANLSAAVLNVSEAAAKGEGSPEKLIDLAGSIQETAQLLTTTSERTAFLDVGLFYLCQLSNNNAITQEQTTALTQLLMVEASGLAADSRKEQVMDEVRSAAEAAPENAVRAPNPPRQPNARTDAPPPST